MRNQTIALAVVLLVLVSAPSRDLHAALGRQIASYRITAKLDVQNHGIDGHETLTWVNTSPDTVRYMPFHLYMNAFKNEQSTFLMEQGGIGRPPKKDDWGWIDVKSIQSQDGTDLKRTMRYLHPDDENVNDRTVLRVDLPRPALPGDTVRVVIDFYTRLPKTVARAGYQGEYYFVAQWFPKTGVYERGGWNCHQYHRSTEFFGEYGTYDVAITVPARFVVGATGKRMAEQRNPDGTVTYTHYQEDVHDFAWTASPAYREFKYRFEHPGLHSVDVTVLLQPEHAGQADRHFNATWNALRYYGEWYGEYPYDVLTVVDPAVGSGTGGMEYPTLFTNGTSWLTPKAVLSPEGVVIHECGHQFWYGLVGNNEFEEAWLDEGFNTFSENRVQEIAYPPGSSVMSLSGYPILGMPFITVPIPGLDEFPLVAYWGYLPLKQSYRKGGRGDGYLANAKNDPMTRRGWEYVDHASYRSMSYAKTAVALKTLEGYLGWDTLQKILAAFQQRWRFRHPTGEDFRAVLNEMSGQNMNWFYDQVIRGTEILDYEVMRISSKPVQKKMGLFEQGGQMISLPEDQAKLVDTTRASSGPMFESEVVVRRLGEVTFPVELLVVFDNGKRVRETWDGQSRWKKFTYTTPARLAYATVDPDNKLYLDVNFANNSKMMKPGQRAALRWSNKWLFWMQGMLHLVGAFV